jgi:hypothetical protein
LNTRTPAITPTGGGAVSSRRNDWLKAELASAIEERGLGRIEFEANLAIATLRSYLEGGRVRPMTMKKLWYWASIHAQDHEVRTWAATKIIPLTRAGAGAPRHPIPNERRM